MGRKKTNMLKKLLGTIFLLVFLLSTRMLIWNMYRSASEQSANEALVQRVEQNGTDLSSTLPEESDSQIQALSWDSQEEPQERNYSPLLQENSHLAGWLILEETGIDLPVMYTPEEPEYYLRRAFDGTDALSGCLFIGANSAPGGTNILIYGHEMKDGSMFGRLDAFADEDYARENSQITYDLIQPDGSYERLTFQVMAAFYSRIYQVDEESVFRYYYCTDLSDPEEYEYYVNQVMAASLYDLGVTAEYGDRLLTLSTCSGHTQDGRFVVVAREAAPGSFSQ